MMNKFSTRKAMPRRSALAVALALGLGVSGLAYGQSTTGNIAGSAAVGETVQAVSASGVTRSVTVGTNGTYTISNLPVGTYSVTLSRDGTAVSSRDHVSIAAGGSTVVNFGTAGATTNLGTVTVTANALPAIDVTTTNSTTTITAAQLKQLPLDRNMTSIALLTPGTMTSPQFGGVSFGGSSVAENAYYVNGYNTGEPYRNMSGFQLPYGAISQQQTMAGAFGAKYGRSDGGVISQIGRSGTNEWHFGGQIVWEPESLASSPRSRYYPSVPVSNTLADGSTIDLPWQRPGGIPGVGQLNNYNGNDKGWSTVYTAYVGGPLIEDKLYFFIDGEYSEGEDHNVSAITSPTYTYSSNHQSKIYGKLNWNITDSNIFELTVLDQKGTSGAGAQFNYDYDTFESGTFLGGNNKAVNNAKFYIGKFTSYLSDNATLEVTYGKGSFHPYTQYAVSTDIPMILNWTNAVWTGPGPKPDVPNAQTTTTAESPASHLDTHGLRVDFTYQLGDHSLMAGLDNMKYRGQHQGDFFTGSAAALDPQTMAFLQADAVSLPGGADTLGPGFWAYRAGGTVQYRNVITIGGMDVKQKAFYLQDDWQISPDWLLNIGLRNDSYSNYTGTGQRFIQQKNQWEPRIGVSWDVMGDSSLKIYANAGRYYLALPLNAANRAADVSTFLYGIYTYSDITANGTPVIIPGTDSKLLPMTSPDGEFGTVKDVDLVVSQNIKPMYMDQFHLGFDAKADFLGTTWTYGAKLNYRHTSTIIDDECAPDVLATKLASMGYDPADYYNSLYVNGYCRLFNPGSTNDFIVKHDVTGESLTVAVTPDDFGWPRKPVRKYQSVDLYFAHPFDGKWEGRIDYTYTRARGNTIGQVRPDIGQDDVSKTEDWDTPALMSGAYGELMNTRKHVVRLRGTYQVTPEWAVSLIGLIQSGQPGSCLGYYGAGANEDPSGYNGGLGGNYHWCMGAKSHPGSDNVYAGHTPWLHQYNLSANWTPAFADHRMTVQLTVFNILNEKKAVSFASSSLPQSYSGPSSASPGRYYNPLFHAGVYEAPRSVRLSVSYDY